MWGILQPVTRTRISLLALWLAGCGDDLPSSSTTTGSSTDAPGTAGSTAEPATAADTTAGSEPAGLTVVATPELLAVLQPFVAHIPAGDITLTEDPDPWAAAQAQGGPVIAVDTGADACGECYRLEGSAGVLHVSGGDRLGAQYGLAHAFEALGVRFFAPYSTFVPPSWAAAAAGVELDASELHEPATAERGIQLHTLHPIEGLYALWVPGEDHLAQAEAIVDWCVKQRVNLLQWVALADIIEDSALAGAWNDHTAAILQMVHDRGMRAGIGIQLFGASNLQRAFDLLDEQGDEATQRAEMTARYDLLLAGLAFDHVTLSFGEFSSQSPDAFLASTNLAYEVLQEVAPGTTMSSVVHVGNYDDTMVEYMGETYIYYLLAQFADPAIVPWVHTVMYYNLFEDAGGAYLHDEFVEHRDLLLSRLEGGLDVGYFPETAYWVAFDNSVPTFLPVYVSSRFVDFDRVREAGLPPIPRHITFSSGWEWGYWLQDVAVLRMAWAVPNDWRDEVRHILSPLPDGEALADATIALAEAQHYALIHERAAPYLAARDALIDVGDSAGILSQPDRPSLDEIPAMTAAERDAIDAGPLSALDELAVVAETAAAELEALPSAPWRDEILDGAQIDALRARYITAIYRAVIAFADGDDPQPFLDDAAERLAGAEAVVARRHAALWSPLGNTLLVPGDNPTIYPNGYLQKAHELCYWGRERVQADNVIDGTDVLVPACYEFTGI
jgi:hypothetical protein